MSIGLKTVYFVRRLIIKAFQEKAHVDQKATKALLVIQVCTRLSK